MAGTTASPSREPATWVAVAAAGITLATTFGLPLTEAQQTILNAAVLAVAGFVTAVWVRRDGQLPAVLGLAQALLAVAVGFGLDWGQERQAAIMTMITVLAAAFVRTQVSARRGPNGEAV
jgi:uncharacterized membrane protein YoaK (UPF0700 family)